MSLTGTFPNLSDTLPRSIEEMVGADNGGGPVVAVAADLTLQGAFGEEWLVVTRDRLLVFPSNGAQPTPRLDLPLAELRSPATDSLVGGSALVATVNGESLELVRYTNARQQRFSRVTKYLEDVAKYHETLAKGEEAKEEPKLAEDTEELKRCPTCRLLLPQGSKRCPA